MGDDEKQVYCVLKQGTIKTLKKHCIDIGIDMNVFIREAVEEKLQNYEGD